MKADFAHMLNSLRHERGLSQKKVADDLGISQALLSHYENGVREPRLEFVVRASEYYGVTADYILGMSKERYAGKLEQLCETEDARRCVDIASVILSMIKGIGDERLASDAGEYLGQALHFVLMYLRYPEMPYEPLFDAGMKRAVSAYIARVRLLHETTDTMPDITDDILRERFPEEYGSVHGLADLITKTLMQFK